MNILVVEDAPVEHVPRTPAKRRRNCRRAVRDPRNFFRRLGLDRFCPFGHDFAYLHPALRLAPGSRMSRRFNDADAKRFQVVAPNR